MKKKAGLVPTDEVTIFYDLKEGYLSSVVKAHLENITTAVRANVVAGKCPEFDEPLESSSEDMKGEFMKGEKLSLQVAHGTIDPNAKQLPAVKFQPIKCGAGDAFILLENPRGNKLGGSAEEIASQIYGKGKMAPSNGEPEFVNLKFIGTDRYGVAKGNIACVVLNNPKYEIKTIDGLKEAGAKLFGWDGDLDKVEIYFDSKKTRPVSSLEKCQGGTVFFTNIPQVIN